MEHLETLNKRNTVTVEKALKEANEKISALQVRIEGLNTTIGTLNNKVDEMQRNLNIFRAMITGRGPTSG